MNKQARMEQYPLLLPVVDYFDALEGLSRVC